MTAPRKVAHNAEFKSFQLLFAPARRSSTDTHAAHGTGGTLAQNLAGNGGSALRKVSSACIKKNDVTRP
jgi:hypothetical protein